MARLGRSNFEQARQSQDLAVPWEQELPPEKRRYDVRFIRGGPGKSGMGIVYLAYDRELKEPFAIKTFQDRFLGSPQAVENFKKEAQIWVELGKHKIFSDSSDLPLLRIFSEWMRLKKQFAGLKHKSEEGRKNKKMLPFSKVHSVFFNDLLQ